MFIENFLLGETSVNIFGFVLMVYDVALLALVVISLYKLLTSTDDFWMLVAAWLIAPIILNGLSLLLGAIGLEVVGGYVFAYRYLGLLAVPTLWFIFVIMPSFFNWRAGSTHYCSSSYSGLPRRYKYVGPDDPGPVDPHGWGPVRRHGMNRHLTDEEIAERIADRNRRRLPTYLLRLEQAERQNRYDDPRGDG
jgi:hypothetical protein